MMPADNTSTELWTPSEWKCHSYSIRMAPGLLEKLLEASDDHREAQKAARSLVLVDGGLPSTTLNRIEAAVARSSQGTELVVVEGGEAAKTPEQVFDIVDHLRSFHLKRTGESVILIGGGALLDAGSFAASIYRRGVPFIKVPTTFLAFVDAAVGIKNGINYKGQKNLLGAFTEPAEVVLDPGLLGGLPHRELISGLGELVKLAVVSDPKLFCALAQHSAGSLPDVYDGYSLSNLISMGVNGMLRELNGNLFEHDLRRRVDFGHTFSPAIELSTPDLRHGEAVLVDVLFSCYLAKTMQLLSAADAERIAKVVLDFYDCTAILSSSVSKLDESIRERTEHRGGLGRIPLPTGIGKCTFVDSVSLVALSAALNESRQSVLRRRAEAEEVTKCE